MTGVGPDPVAVLVRLAEALRSAGIDVGPDRVALTVRAAAVLDAGSRNDVYWAGRATMLAAFDDIGIYDGVFAAAFDDGDVPAPRRPTTMLVQRAATAVPDSDPHDEGGSEADVEASLLRSAASSVEVLRHRDLATVDDPDRAALNRELARFTLISQQRRSRRHVAARRGSVDVARTARAVLHSGGELALLARHRPRPRPRRVVLLVDVSGSMAPYADALMRFAHAAGRHGGGRTELFAIGTRLTRLTRQLRVRDPDAAMDGVARAVADWGGGTRLGVLLGEFLDRWGQPGMARGAVVVVLSDGWERDDPALLGEQMARLSRIAHRIVWSNPRKARPGYAPVAGGMAAALPYVDDFVEGHSLAALQAVARAVAGPGDRPVARDLIRAEARGA